MFHRVHFRCGDASGTTHLKWAPEVTAVWAQKRRPHAVRDYQAALNEGLGTTERGIMDGSSDGAHLSICLRERAGGEAPTIRDAWHTCQMKRRSLVNEARAVIPARIPGQSFDAIASSRMFANAYEDLRDATPGLDYAEGETRTAVGNGPRTRATRRSVPLVAGTDRTATGRVAQFGASDHP